MQTRKLVFASTIVALVIGVAVLSALWPWPRGRVSSSSPKPDMAALTGRWAPTQESLTAIKMLYAPVRQGSLELAKDGTTHFDEVPDFFTARSERYVGTLSGPGTWSIASDREWQSWVVSIDTPAGGTELFITGSAPNYNLVAIIGDPDSGEALTFVRVASNAGPN
jgi:hypothetical protein